jgi:Integrase core domain
MTLQLKYQLTEIENELKECMAEIVAIPLDKEDKTRGNKEAKDSNITLLFKKLSVMESAIVMFYKTIQTAEDKVLKEKRASQQLQNLSDEIRKLQHNKTIQDCNLMIDDKVIPMLIANREAIRAKMKASVFKGKMTHLKTLFEFKRDVLIDEIYGDPNAVASNHVIQADFGDKRGYAVTLNQSQLLNLLKAKTGTMKYDDFYNTYTTPDTMSVAYDRYSRKNKQSVTVKQQPSDSGKTKGNIFQTYNHFNFTKADVEKVIRQKQSKTIQDNIYEKAKTLLGQTDNEDFNHEIWLDKLTEKARNEGKRYHISYDTYRFFMNLTEYQNFLLTKPDVQSYKQTGGAIKTDRRYKPFNLTKAKRKKSLKKKGAPKVAPTILKPEAKPEQQEQEPGQEPGQQEQEPEPEQQEQEEEQVQEPEPEQAQEEEEQVQEPEPEPEQAQASTDTDQLKRSFKRHSDQLFRELDELEDVFTEEDINNLKDRFKTNIIDAFKELVVKTIHEKTNVPNDVYLFLKFYDFEVEGDKLYIEIDVDGHKKRFYFVPNEEKRDLIMKLMDENNGLSVEKLYLLICDTYIGITEKFIRNTLSKVDISAEDDIKTAMKPVEAYQLTKNTYKHVNMPVLATSPNYKWAVDLIDLNYYRLPYQYLLTVIDVFSKKCWIERLVIKESSVMTDAFIRVIYRAGVFPKEVMSDNGGEFQKHLKYFCRNQRLTANGIQKVEVYVQLFGQEKLIQKPEIKIVNTLSYSPRSNGLVENLNKFVRKLIRNMIVTDKNNRLWINKLPEIEAVKNNMKNSTTKFTPNQIWTPRPFANKPNLTILSENVANVQPVQEKAAARLSERAKQILSTNQEYHVGDIVRVKMATLYSHVRQKIKSGDKKNITLSFSPVLYQITGISAPNAKEQRNKLYMLSVVENGKTLGKEIHGEALDEEHSAAKTKKVRPRRLFGNELQLVIPAEKVTEDLMKALKEYETKNKEDTKDILMLDNKIIGPDIASMFKNLKIKKNT